MGYIFHEEQGVYLHTLFHLNPPILVIVHHLMDAPKGLQAEAISLAHAWWRHYGAGVCMGGKGNNNTSRYFAQFIPK